MKTLIQTVLLLLIVNISSAQDNRIQEPVKNFDKVWNEFNDRYAFFEYKKIDWEKVYGKYRPLINEETTNDSLFTICNNMLLELKDGHVSLVQYGKNKTVIRESDDGHHNVLTKKFPITKESEPNIYQLIDTAQSILQENGFSNLVKSKSKKLQYSTSKDYGYLLIYQMYGFELGELKSLIHEAIEAFKDKNGVIIDVRFNGGGHDRVSRVIAGHFTNQERVGYRKKERKNGSNEYHSLKTLHIKPKGSQQFTKPVMLLTSDFTASAADVFTLMMKELPYVTIIGDNTQGIFSDKYNFTLPNKWRVSLSHQQYFSADMVNYEGIGVQPHHRLLNNLEEFNNGLDPLVTKAIELLENNNR